MSSRLAARVITGPCGHFVAGALDLAALFGRLLWARLGGGSPW